MGVRNLFFKSSPSQNPSGNLTKLYITALTAVALLTILGQVLIQQSIKDQLTDSRVVNFAGKQRFKSQEISKLVLLIQYNYTHKGYSDKGKYLDSLLSTWEKEHSGLERGDAELELPGNNSAEILLMFQDANPYFYAILENARKVVRYVTVKNSIAFDKKIELAVRTVMDNEKAFLDRMDRMVHQYDGEAKAKVLFLRRVENILLIITLVILVLEGFFIFRPAVNKIKETIHELIASEKKASDLAAELYQANLSLKESYQREHIVKSAALIEGQEKERKFIAMELHDGLVQLLTALKINLQFFPLPDDKKLAEKLENTKALAMESIAEARKISFNLMPSTLYDFGVASALKHLSENISDQSGIPIEFNKEISSLKLKKKYEVHLYRIAQEALSNAVKYSQCTYINISIKEVNENYLLTISDNGKGFDMPKTYEDKNRIDSGNGFANMKERVNIIDGKIIIQSSRENGTTIQVEIPKE